MKDAKMEMEMKMLITALLSAGILMGFSAALADGGGLYTGKKHRAPLVSISSETIDALTEAGKNFGNLEAAALIDGHLQATGYVNEDYRICFEGFPWFWRKALISVRCKDGGVFEKSLVTFFKQEGTINAVTTAAATACGGNPLKYYLAKLRLERALRKVGSGKLFPKKVRLTKMVLMTALVSRNIISDELGKDIDTYLEPDTPLEDLKLAIPDFETGETVTVGGYDFAPNQFGMGTNQGQENMPRGGSPFMLKNPLRIGSVIENPFHARLRERAVHEHLDVFIDLDSGASRIVAADTLPEWPGWDICIKHLRHGWPYMRLNYTCGVSGANVGQVDWDTLLDVSDVTLHHGPDNPGILIIAHGEPAPEWNLAVDEAVDRIKTLHPEYPDLPIELAFLEDEMVEEDPRNEELGLTGKGIVEALDRLRCEGVEWVGVVPLMVNNCSGHIEEIRWLMGQSVEPLTSTWTGNLVDEGLGSFVFEGFICEKGSDLSGEMALLNFDEHVDKLEGGVGGTVNEAGNLILEGNLSGYSADGEYYCEVTLSEVTGTTDFNDMVGTFTGSWTKKRMVDGEWVVEEGDLSGDWNLGKTGEGKPDLSGLEVFLGSAVEDHPFMQETQKARVSELIDGKDPADMSLVLGVHGADVSLCDEEWYEMGEGIIGSILTEMPFVAAQTAFMEELGDAVADHVATYGDGNAALALHMIAPGSLTRAMPFIAGWPGLMPGIHYLYNQKTLLAYENQEDFNLPGPPFSRFPSMRAEELAELILDKTSDLFIYWMANHSLELVSAYPVGDSWHGEKSADKVLEMTDNIYVIRTDRNRYAKVRVFAAGRCLVSLEYCYQTILGRPIFE